MPIYEYRCGVCSQRVEVLVRSDGSQPACPDCGSVLSDKLFSVPNILSGRSKRPPVQTCCGQQERCDSPQCSYGDECPQH